jgi:hypothetical protein
MKAVDKFEYRRGYKFHLMQHGGFARRSPGRLPTRHAPLRYPVQYAIETINKMNSHLAPDPAGNWSKPDPATYWH